MIPIALVVGLVVGRWWALALAAAGWAIVLVATGATGIDGSMAAGAGLALANAAVGVGIHKGFGVLFREGRALSSH